MGSYAVSENLMELGKRIQDRRMKLGMSQEETAEKVSVSANTISRIEGGKNAMSVELFIRLLRVLDISADELLGGMISDVKKDGLCESASCRIRHLKKREQEILMQAMDILLENCCHTYMVKRKEDFY